MSCMIFIWGFMLCSDMSRVRSNGLQCRAFEGVYGGETILKMADNILADDFSTNSLPPCLPTDLGFRTVALYQEETGECHDACPRWMRIRRRFPVTLKREVFGKYELIKTEDAVGCMLCHDITQIIPGVVKDAVFRKGHVVTREDIPVLLSVGKEHLYVWEKQEGMLHEDEAAEILRSVCQNAQMDASKPKEGKIELTAQCDGVLKVDKEKLCRINAMGQMCISSRHGNFPVKKGDKIAGMRVIPLVIEEEKMKQVKETAGETPVFALLPFQKKKAAIVTTGSEVYHGRIQDKFTPVVRQKLEEYGEVRWKYNLQCDEPDMVTEAVNDWIKKVRRWLCVPEE